MSVLVWIEQMNGHAVASSLEVLGKGRQIADDIWRTLSGPGESAPDRS